MPEDLDAVLRGIDERLGAGGGSRYVAPGASPEYVAHVAGGGTAADYKGAPGTRVAQPDGAVAGAELLRAVKAARLGDAAAYGRLARTAKAITDGQVMVAADRLGGYIEARQAAGPIRALTTEREVAGRQVELLLEGNQVEVDFTPEGGTKPYSEASVVLAVSTVFKAAGVTVVPDELLADTNGLAADLVARQFGGAIGRKTDLALLDGTGTGQPRGVLRTVAVNHENVSGQSGEALFDDIAAAVSRLRAKFYEPTAVVMRPEVGLRFDTARATGSGEFLFADWRARIGVPVVYDSNVPVAAGPPATAPIIVGDWRLLWFFSRGGLVIESNEAPHFESDETTFRAYERFGAAVVRPEAFEVLDGVEV